MKRWIHLTGALTMLVGLSLLAFAGVSYYQTERIALLPPNEGSSSSETLPAFGLSSLPTPIIFPTTDPSQTSPALLVTSGSSSTDVPVNSTASPRANPPIASPTVSLRPQVTPQPVIPGARTSRATKMFVRGIELKKDIPVSEADWVVSEVNGQWTADWNIPFSAAGHHSNTPNPGQVGNVVISGHHNLVGPNQFGIGLFAYFWNLKSGDKIYFTSSDGIAYEYAINASYPVLEQGQPLAVREQHAAQILGPSEEAIVTLVTCWAGPQNPFASNTYRWIVVANLVGKLNPAAIPPAQ